MTGFFNLVASFKTSEIQKFYHSIEYINWRRTIFERDDYTCQLCEERGTYLEAHHIKERCNYPELVFEIDNGITLCNACHNLTKYRVDLE